MNGMIKEINEYAQVEYGTNLHLCSSDEKIMITYDLFKNDKKKLANAYRKLASWCREIGYCFSDKGAYNTLNSLK